MNSYSSPLPLTFGGYLLLAVGLLLIGISIPLIKRSIQMNQYYGVRTPEAFKSEENWYEINSYGGKQLLGLVFFTTILSALDTFFVLVGIITHELVVIMSVCLPFLIGLRIVFVRIMAYNEQF